MSYNIMYMLSNQTQRNLLGNMYKRGNGLWKN